LFCALLGTLLSFDCSSAMIFLQMVNGLRHYPVANAVAQTFPHPVILNETGVRFALTEPRPATAATTTSGLLLAKNDSRFRQIIWR
jgi:hypothetical protein